MRSSMMACAAVATTAAVLAGCSADGNNQFASRDTTVEYYRVFDIRTEVGAPAVAKAASDGINRNVKDAVVSTPATVDVTELPGHFKMADASAAAATPPGAPAADKGPTCEGASWTAKAAPHVRGGDNMNLVACIFPYKNGYHLDMYAVFTKPEGGLLAWPRRLGGKIVGTPEKFTETTMMDVVRAIHDGTKAQVTLVEAKPTLAGTPWLDNITASSAAAPAAPVAPAAVPAAAAPVPASASDAAPVSTQPVTQPAAPSPTTTTASASKQPSGQP